MNLVSLSSFLFGESDGIDVKSLVADLKESEKVEHSYNIADRTRVHCEFLERQSDRILTSLSQSAQR